MRSLAITLLLLEAASAQSAGALRMHALKSAIYGNERQIRVWVPPDYDAKRTYPILLLNDGQNLFDASTAVLNALEWKADETASRLVGERRIAPLLIAGIDNAGRRGRAFEYLPWADEFLTPPVPHPRGDRYPEFVESEVLPLLHREYRLDPKRMVFGGSSYGALIALYTALQRPGLFQGLLLESPSFYVAERAVLALAAQKRSALPRAIYLGAGTNEMGRPDCRPGDRSQEAVRDVLELAKLAPHAKVVIEDCATHNEDAWARRFPVALQHLFGSR